MPRKFWPFFLFISFCSRDGGKAVKIVVVAELLSYFTNTDGWLSQTSEFSASENKKKAAGRYQGGL